MYSFLNPVRTLPAEKPIILENGNFPNRVSLSDKEKISLKRSTRFFTAAFILIWCIAFTSAPWMVARSVEQWNLVPAVSWRMAALWLIWSSCGFAVFFGLKTTYLFLKNAHLDVTNGVKLVGEVEIISKNSFYSSESGNNYHVTFKWKGHNEENLIDIQHAKMYSQVREGQIIYLEILPLSNEVLHYRIP